MDDDHGVLNTRLELGIGLNDFVPKRNNHDEEQKKTNKPLISLDLSFPSNGEDEEIQEGDSSNNMNSDPNKDDNDEVHVQKVLRLTKEQSTVLENSFKNHTSLNTAQKNELAEKLELKPRQVQVWFQNRRSRTKMKQTEVDCEFMKKCYENLSEENRKLKKEIEELRSSISTTSTPFLVQLQKATAATTIAVCPSCEMKMVTSKVSCSDDITEHERP